MFEIDECNKQMQETVLAYDTELKNIRTGRVSPDILKPVKPGGCFSLGLFKDAFYSFLWCCTLKKF